MSNIHLPGMVTAASAAGTAVIDVQRAAPNVWWLAFAAAAHGINGRKSPEPLALPSRAVAADAGPVAMTLAKVELDTCGAWITVANAEAVRPVVVRRAGWVDVRGHPFDGVSAVADDRVGLGPGDALVLARPTAGNDTTHDDFLDCLLSATPAVDDIHAAALAACGGPAAAVAVVAVPHELGDDPRQRVATATGVPADELELPGYPLGDLQPELWSAPPRPPRLARLRLRADVSSVREVRSLLGRLVASWRLDDVVDEEGLKLAASELATNAVEHGMPSAATVRYFAQGLRVEVDDDSPESPAMRHSDWDDVGGRGLHVVDAVATNWGVEPRPSGKRVWCEVGFRA